MAFENYAELQSQIQKFLWGRADLADQIPSFIALAEAQMRRKLRTRQSVDTFSLNITSESAGTPCDLGDILSIRLTEGMDPVELDYMSPENFDSLYLTSPSRPRFWTMVNDRLLFAPAPDGSYPAKIRYRDVFEALSSTNRTNWVLKRHPDIYLYGSLVASAPYLEEDGRLAMWQTLFDQGIDEANRDQPMRGSNSTLRNDQMAMIGGRGGYNIYKDC